MTFKLRHYPAVTVLDLASRQEQHFSKMADQATAGSVRILLRAADRQVLAEAARSRKQSLEAFLSETLACAAVDLRTAPAPRLTPLDVYSRRTDLAPDTTDDGDRIQWTEPRPNRQPRLAAGPPRNR